jgi:hypothetical protein
MSLEVRLEARARLHAAQAKIRRRLSDLGGRSTSTMLLRLCHERNNWRRALLVICGGRRRGTRASPTTVDRVSIESPSAISRKKCIHGRTLGEVTEGSGRQERGCFLMEHPRHFRPVCGPAPTCEDVTFV